MEQQDSAQWEFFFTEVGEKPMSISLDLSMAESGRQSGYPYLARVYIFLQHPDENGFTTAAESEVLNDVEDGLVDRLAPGALLAGKVKGDGKLILFFYAAAEAGIEEAADAAMAEGYEYAVEITEDRDWEAYTDFLYPDAYDFKAIMNRRVLTQLQEGGDPLEAAREIDHWAYFKTAADAGAFGKAVATEGFRVLSTNADSANEAFPLSLNFSRSDEPNLTALNDITWYLMDAAEAHGGEYDGWGCTVVKG